MRRKRNTVSSGASRCSIIERMFIINGFGKFEIIYPKNLIGILVYSFTKLLIIILDVRPSFITTDPYEMLP